MRGLPLLGGWRVRVEALSTHVPCVSHVDPLLGFDSPFFSAIVLANSQPFPQGCWWFSRKKDPWKEWGSFP